LSDSGPSSSASSFQPLVSTGTHMDSATLPLKNFMHEVLKHQVQSCKLWYLEAVCPKVPGILRDEKLGVKFDRRRHNC
jgi:hypothetical protein